MTQNKPKSNSTSKHLAPGALGRAGSGPLEVTHENGSFAASGLAHPPSARPTRVTVRYDGAVLSIAATYEPKWRGPVEGSISLPLDMGDPCFLLPLLDGEQPWKPWPEIEAFVRQAIAELQVPQRMSRMFDRHLHILRAIRNGPELSKMRSDHATEKAHRKALLWLTDRNLDCQIAESIRIMRDVLIKSTPISELACYGNAMRYYKELVNEKQRRLDLSELERMDEQLCRLQEEERSRRRRKAVSYRS
ncbi:hypothetical protein [Limimaricola cinnabarinus]|uniref:hypothetical protein n=1 Tax=Limimaricola cinnabarinus TaxID=1125964 RepID=UPI0013A61B13|nr:hypothetical protein [Limimaricola cinnabarinus]